VPITGDTALFTRSVNIPVVINSIKEQAITVTTAATALPAVALTDRKNLSLYNNGASDIFIGSSTVTASGGFPVPRRTSLSLDVNNNVIVYAITSAGTADVRILEVS